MTNIKTETGFDRLVESIAGHRHAWEKEMRQFNPNIPLARDHLIHSVVKEMALKLVRADYVELAQLRAEKAARQILDTPK